MHTDTHTNSVTELLFHIHNVGEKTAGLSGVGEVHRSTEQKTEKSCQVINQFYQIEELVAFTLVAKK